MRAASHRFEPALLCAAMFLSGAAALGYEIVWLRMLTRSFGVTVHAVSFLVALFFAGLALGSWAASYWTRGKRDWLGLYAVLEIAGAATAALSTLWMQGLPERAAALSATLSPTAARVLLGAPALLIPTFFFGATLPVLSRRWIARLDQVGGGTGSLYAANTFGAMAGAAAAGFFAIAAFGELRTAAAAAVLNILAAGAALWARARARQTSGEAAPSASEAPAGRLIFLLFALSGFCAVGYEVLWVRRLGWMLGNSGYSFTLFLLAYLGGTAAGSAAGGAAKPTKDAWQEYGLLQLALALAAVLSLGAADRLALSLDDPSYLYSPLQTAGDFFKMALGAAVVVFPASFVMGLAFPVAARLAVPRAEAAGRSVGRLYAVNTAGGILGSLVVGFWGVEILGTHKTFLLLALLTTVGAIVALRRARTPVLRPAAALGAALAAALIFCRNDGLTEIILKRLAKSQNSNAELLFHEETAAGTATGMRAWGNGVLFVNGILTAGTGTTGALMISIANTLLEHPRRTMFIGIGCGVTLRAAGLLGGEVVAVDLLEPVARNVGIFQPGIEEELARPGINLVIDDGRNYLQAHAELFDLILVDATPPLYSAGTVNLYTVDFLTLAKSRLSEDGIFALWLPLKSFESDYWSILRGMADAFPHLKVWNHPRVNDGILFLASKASLERPEGLVDERLARRVRPAILQRMFEEDVALGYQVSEADLRAMASKYPAVTDDRPLTEFPLANFIAEAPQMESHDFLLKAKGAATAR